MSNETLEVEEVRTGNQEKVVYIGPNIQGILNGTIFDYMPNLESYKEYKNLEKLFVSLGSLKEETLKLKEKTSYLHIIFDDIVEIKNKKGSVK